MKRKILLRAAAPLLALTLVAGACGSDDDDANGQGAGSDDAPTTPAGETASAETGAATLRAGLTGLLSEHVYLAALATGSALRGDTKGFEAYVAALNGPT